MAIAYSYPKGTPTLTDTLVGIQYEVNKDPAVKQFGIGDIVDLVPVVYTTLPYKVYTALLTQGGVNELLNKSSGSLTKGVTYKIDISTGGADFTNVGAPNNVEGTLFVATASIPPTSYGTGNLTYNLATPVVTVLENTIGNIWFDFFTDGGYTVLSSGLFTEDKTCPTIQATAFDGNENVGYYITIAGVSSMDITTISSLSGQQDGWLYKTPIEIKVYN